MCVGRGTLPCPSFQSIIFLPSSLVRLRNNSRTIFYLHCWSFHVAMRQEYGQEPRNYSNRRSTKLELKHKHENCCNSFTSPSIVYEAIDLWICIRVNECTSICTGVQFGLDQRYESLNCFTRKLFSGIIDH